MATAVTPPEYNVTGLDYADRLHFRHHGPLLDVHAHVMTTRPGETAFVDGPPGDTEQAAVMLAVAAEFGIAQTVSMCSPDDIPPLRSAFGDRLLFNGVISKKTADEPDDAAVRLLARYLELGVVMIKFWSAPRGRDRGLLVDAPWRIDAVRRARAAGLRLIMVHVADPDAWFRTAYADASKYGTKPDQYVGLERMLQMFPDMTWIGAHLGGDAEHPDHLHHLLETYPHFHLDTSATKWVVREVSPRAADIRALVCKFPDRFLFGSDLVTRDALVREHYVSRYWCQRTLWESAWQGPSPIADPDHVPADGEGPTPTLRGVDLPDDVLAQVYYHNAHRLLNLPIV